MSTKYCVGAPVYAYVGGDIRRALITGWSSDSNGIVYRTPYGSTVHVHHDRSVILQAAIRDIEQRLYALRDELKGLTNES